MFVSLFKALCSPMFFFYQTISISSVLRILTLIEGSRGEGCSAACRMQACLGGGPSFAGRVCDLVPPPPPGCWTQTCLWSAPEIFTPARGTYAAPIGQSAPASPVTWQRNHWPIPPEGTLPVVSWSWWGFNIVSEHLLSTEFLRWSAQSRWNSALNLEVYLGLI